MKKFCEVVKVFVVGLIYSSIMIFSTNCQAVDYYVGNYSDGAKAYLMTESIQKYEILSVDGTASVGYIFNVKAVYSNHSRIDDYKFDGIGGYFYVNGKRRIGKAENGDYWTTVEKNIMKYIAKIKWRN